MELFFLPTKAEAVVVLVSFVEKVTSLGYKLGGLRCDQGGEYTSKLFKSWAHRHGIQVSYTGSHSSPQHGIVERPWRTLADMARCMLEQAGLPKRLWAELYKTASYLLNRLPSKALGGCTPYSVVYGREAPMDHLRVIGCMAYIHIYDADRQKLDPKAWRGVLVGYDTDSPSYRVLDLTTMKVKISPHVTFNEDLFPAMQLGIGAVDLARPVSMAPPMRAPAGQGGESMMVPTQSL
jgi:hypothetical protein